MFIGVKNWPFDCLKPTLTIDSKKSPKISFPETLFLPSTKEYLSNC